MLSNLICLLSHDDGRTEYVSCAISDGWQATFEYLLEVYCKDNNTVELRPLRIELLGDVDATYNSVTMEMEFVDCD